MVLVEEQLIGRENLEFLVGFYGIDCRAHQVTLPLDLIGLTGLLDALDTADIPGLCHFPITAIGVLAVVAAMAGAIEEKIDFVIADSSYIDMENAVKDNAWRMNYIPEYPIPYLGFSLAAWLAEFDPWSVSPINALREINKPVLITHCDLDVWAYPEYAYQLYEASNKELTELKMFSDCEHVEAYGKYTEQYEKMVEGFLLRHVTQGT